MFQQAEQEAQEWQRGLSKQSSEQPRLPEEQRLALLEELYSRVQALVDCWEALEYLESIYSQTQSGDVGDDGGP